MPETEITALIEKRVEDAVKEYRRILLEEIFNPSEPFDSAQGISKEPYIVQGDADYSLKR